MNESVNGEKLSFKGRLGGSVKCDESVVNSHFENPNKNGENGCNRSITDNKSFSFKGISNRNKAKNDERDTINDILNSQNSSPKSIIKEFHNVPEEINYTQLGFSNLGLGTNKPKIDNEQSYTSFGKKISINPKSKSPNKNLFSDNNRYSRAMFDDIPNHSMMGVIDDNSNNNEHKFIFAQDTKMSKVDEGHSMSMFFKNQHSNSYLMYQGTPKKFEEPQHNFFDAGENSNISAMFPRLDNSNNMSKKLFQKEIVNDNSQFGLGLLQSSHHGTPIQEKDIDIEKDTIEVEPNKINHEIINHEIQLQQGVTGNMDD